MKPFSTLKNLVSRCNLFICLSLACVFSCNKEKLPATTSPAIQTYLDEILAAMQGLSVNRKTIDWPTFKQAVNIKALGSQTKEDLYPAIDLALTMLADNHSSYVPAVGGISLTGTRTIRCTDITGAFVPATGNIGYLKVPASGGYDEKGVAYGLMGTTYSQAIQDAIKAADRDGLQGWIVDLRGNLGGDSWAMLAGVGPILGEGLAGYFVDPDATYSAWSYEKGKVALNNGSPIYSISTPYTLRKPNPKVAVLTDKFTASAAEATAIAFKGRPNTRSFGNPTCGLSTGNQFGRLSDGAVLGIASSKMADRTKTVYGQAVQPDELLSSLPAVEKAIDWLLH